MNNLILLYRVIEIELLKINFFFQIKMEDEKDTKNETDMEVEKKREAFGNRHLTSDQNVFDFNAW